jgi:hypothetical protein
VFGWWGEKKIHFFPSIDIYINFTQKKIMKYILSALLLLPILLSYAQVSFEKRLEIDLKDDDYDNHQIFEFGENGFIIRAAGKKSTQGQDIRYSIYNSDIQNTRDFNELIYIKKSSTHILLNNNTKIIECAYEMNGKLQVIMVSSTGSEIQKLQINAPKGMRSMRGVCTENNAVLIFGSSKSFELMNINLQTSQVSKKELKIKDFKATQIRLNTISVTNNQDDIIISYEIKTTTKQRGENPNMFQDYLLSYNCKENEYDVIPFYHKNAKNILELNAAKIGESSYAISGSFNTRTGAAVGNSLGEGVFFALIENNMVKNYTEKSYAQLEEFLKHLPQRTQNKLEKKKKRKENRGKEIKFTSWCVFHGLVVTESGYYSLSEHYHPTYVTYTTTDANGRTTTRQVFDGYQYTHATLIKFDKNGEFVWDRSFTMYPFRKPYFVKKFISAKYLDNEFRMLFSDGDRISFKSFNDNGKVVNENYSEVIPTTFDGDKTKLVNSDIKYWYDNFFLAYGISVIKNKDADKAKRKRKVFFVSKVKFE